MDSKISHLIKLSGVLIAIFITPIIFFALAPFVFKLDGMIFLKIFIELLPYIVMVCFILLICCIQEKPILKTLGFSKDEIGKQFLNCIIIFTITSTFIIIPLLIGMNKQDILGSKAIKSWILIYQIIKSIIFVGIGEEIIWRGYILNEFKNLIKSPVIAVIISSILFGVWHYSISHNIMQVLMTSILGGIYGFARIKIKNCTTLSVGLAHGFHDALIIILSYVFL